MCWKRMSSQNLQLCAFVGQDDDPRETLCSSCCMAKLFLLLQTHIKTSPPGQGPRPFPRLGLSALFPHLTMHLCLSVVWPLWACIWLPNSRECVTPGRPLGDHIRGPPYPWPTPGRPHPRDLPTPGPPLGDQIRGTPHLPLAHPWATKP